MQKGLQILQHGRRGTPIAMAFNIDLRSLMSLSSCALNSVSSALASGVSAPSSSFAVLMCFSSSAFKSIRKPSSFLAAFEIMFKIRSVTLTGDVG